MSFQKNGILKCPRASEKSAWSLQRQLGLHQLPEPRAGEQQLR